MFHYVQCGERCDRGNLSLSKMHLTLNTTTAGIYQQEYLSNDSLSGSL